jgi:hypothetical protein
VIGKGEKMIAIGFIPLGDHFGKIVTVAPEGVRVQVAFPPAEWLSLQGGKAGKQKGQAVYGNHSARCYEKIVELKR